MIIKRLMLFSLEEGKFTGNKPSVKSTYISQATTGTALGAGIGALAGKGKGTLIGAGIGVAKGALGAGAATLAAGAAFDNISNN